MSGDTSVLAKSRLFLVAFSSGAAESEKQKSTHPRASTFVFQSRIPQVIARHLLPIHRVSMNSFRLLRLTPILLGILSLTSLRFVIIIIGSFLLHIQQHQQINKIE